MAGVEKKDNGISDIQNMTKRFLKYFITEPIYIIHEKQQKTIIPETIENQTESIVAGTDTKINLPDKTDTPIHDEGKIMIVVRYPYVTTLPENEKVLLINILKAIHKSFSEITLINIEFDKIPDKSILTDYALIIIFDCDLETLAVFNISGELYQLQTTGETDFIVADPLESIHADISKKSRLWKVLKKYINSNLST